MADDCRATAAPEEGIWEPLGEPVGPAGSSPLGVYRLSGCAFGEDALLLARFSAPRPGERVCDLGTGTGILPLYWHRLRTDAADGVFFVDAVEREPVAASLARRAVEESGLSPYIRVWQADLRALDRVLPAGAYDRVTCNPPYFPAGSGPASFPGTPEAARRRMARQDGAPRCTLDQVLAAASRLLTNGGRFCICHRPERLADLLSGLRACSLEPKRLRLLLAAPGDAVPWLVLCEAKKGAGPGLQTEVFMKGEEAP